MNDRRKKKIKTFIQTCVEKKDWISLENKIKKIHKKEEKYEQFLLVLEEVCYEETNKAKLFTMFSFFLESPRSYSFSLFYELILANYERYIWLAKEYELEPEGEFYTFLLRKAESFPEEDGRLFALSILMILEESFTKQKNL